MEKTITFFPTQAAKMLLATLLLTLTAQTARAAEYEISTLEELREFMEAVHVEDFAGDDIRLTADIDCEGGRFNTGDPEYPSTFRGTFDGQGHKIYNFVHGPTGDGVEGYGTAMFDFAETGATIMNLTLEGTLPGTYSGAYSAAFVLAVESPLGLHLENCHFNGSVTNVYHSAALVGFASSGAGIEVPSITLINCSANANITTTRNYIAGGLVAKGTGVQAYNCSFKGKVTSLGTVGGLIGVAINCTLENCFEGGYTYIDENSNNVYSTYTLFTYTLFSGFSAYSYHIPHNINDTYGNEGYAKLVDGDKNTKWCVSYPYNTSNQWKPISVCFNYDFEFTPKGYILTTGNDVENHPDRMPKVWSLYGWDETGQAWDLLDHHDGQSNPLPGGNKEYRTYFLTDNGGTAKNYQKFMFKIEEIARENESWDGLYGGGWVTNEDDFVCELSELSFFGTADIHDLTNSTVSGIKPYYEYTDNTINLKYKVMDCSGNILTEDTHYTKAITRKNNNDGTWPDVSEVSESGEYIITFTGTAPYTGTKSVPFVVTDPALPSPLISSVENGNQIYYVKIPATGLMNLDLSASATPFTQPFYVYSDNGPGRDYSANSNGQLVITAPQDYVLQIEGDVRSEGYPNDYLVIYDGENNQTAVLGDNYFGSSGTQQIPLLNTTGQVVMLNFISNNAYNTEGVRLLVTPVSKSAANDITITTADNGNVTTSPTANVRINTEVVLNINPSNGYLLQSITATAGGKTVGIDGGLWYLNDPDSQDDERETATFVMPGADVTVTPTFAATNALSVNMPNGIANSADALKVFIPDDVTSFKVYNAKDENGGYARNTVSYVQLIAPEGLRLQISGTIDANGGAYLEAYDGTDKNNLLGRCDKDNTDIGMLVSSDNQVLLLFASDDATPGQGIDITVRVLAPDASYSIPTVSVAEGTITPNKPTAQVGENVNLQIEPSNGYRLNALKVTQTIDGKDYEVPVTGGLWHDTNPTQASFVMPANDVAITPIFTNKSTAADDGLYINMPEFNYSYAPKTVNITSDITSFKVYDDGGKDGNCSPYCDSYMVLKAPAGMVLRLTGTVTVDESSAFLAVYDGDDTSHQIGTNYGNTTGENIGQLTSSGRSLMLRFHSGYPSNYAGLALYAEWKKLMTNDDISASVPNQTLDGYTKASYKFEAANSPSNGITIGESVKDGETLLTLGTDYTFGSVSYQDPNRTPEYSTNPYNDQPGDECLVEIRGMGAYAGTVSVPFTIISPSANGTHLGLSWSLAGGTLSITGKGAMAAVVTNDYPWKKYCSLITTINIGEGVTSIADNAFGSVSGIYTYNNVTKVTIPSTVTSIGADAFKGCISATDVYCYADSEKLTWSDTGDDFKSDGSTVCHVANASAWNNNDKFSNVHVTFEGNLANVSIPYIDADGTTAYCTDFTELRTDNPENLNFNNLPGGWYVVENSNTDNERNGGADFFYCNAIHGLLKFNGDAHLILCDGAEMRISYNEDASLIQSVGALTIYGQSGSSGKLSVESTYGLDGSGTPSAFSIQNDFIINGGNISASVNCDGAMAIDCGKDITINGGTVNITAPDNATDGIYVNNMTINGGTVLADATINTWSSGTVTIAEQMIDCTSGTKRAITESIDGNVATALQTLFGNNASVNASFSRTFTSGVASTICLPFAVSQQKAAEVGTFYDFTSVNGDWTEVTMTEVNTSLTANTPYLFMPAATGEQPFSGTVTCGETTAGTKTVAPWAFTGTYEEKRWDATHNTDEIGRIFGFATNQGYEGQGPSQNTKAGDFIRLNSGGIKPFRAYLKYTGSLQARTRGEGGLPETMTVRLVNANGEIQGIGEIRLSTGEVTFDSRAWYDLNGRRLDGQPSEKGIYINGGRKVVIK